MENEIDKLMENPKNPFKVPEGYFDTITSRVMERIPENEVKLIPTETQGTSKKKTWWRSYAAAAAVIVAIFGAGLLIHNNGSETEETVATGNKVVNTVNSKNNVEAMADYIMADDYELYAYIAYE